MIQELNEIISSNRNFREQYLPQFYNGDRFQTRIEEVTRDHGNPIALMVGESESGQGRQPLIAIMQETGRNTLLFVRPKKQYDTGEAPLRYMRYAVSDFSFKELQRCLLAFASAAAYTYSAPVTHKHLTNGQPLSEQEFIYTTFAPLFGIARF